MSAQHEMDEKKKKRMKDEGEREREKRSKWSRRSRSLDDGMPPR